MIYDIVIMRTIIDIPDEQAAELSALCKSQGISRAEAIRRSLAVSLACQRTSGLEGAFGAWKHKGMDARKFVETLRGEW